MKTHDLFSFTDMAPAVPSVAPSPAYSSAPILSSAGGRPARSVFDQTGWRRPGVAWICQEMDVLDAIHEHDYDICNEAFMDYFHRRTGISFSSFGAPWNLGGSLGNGENAEALERLQKISPSHFLDWRTPVESLPRPVHVIDGSACSEEEVAFHKRHILHLRARLQDIWELFNSPELERYLNATFGTSTGNPLFAKAA